MKSKLNNSFFCKFQVLNLFSSLDEHGLDVEYPLNGLFALFLAKVVGYQNSMIIKEQEKIIDNQFTLVQAIEYLTSALRFHFRMNNNPDALVDAKLTILIGDLLLAKANQFISKLGNSQVHEMFTTAYSNILQSYFIKDREVERISNRMNLSYWIKKNFMSLNMFPFGSKCMLNLAHLKESEQNLAFGLSQNFAFFVQGYKEIAHFNNDIMSDHHCSKSVDFVSLPVIMHFNETGDSLDLVCYKNQSNFVVDPIALHQLVRDGPGLDRSKQIIESFRVAILVQLDTLQQRQAESKCSSFDEMVTLFNAIKL